MSLVRFLILISASLFCSFGAIAEPATPPGDEIKAIKLDYSEQDGFGGRLAAAEVTVAEQAVRYYVRGTNVSAPFSIQVIAASTARPLEVTLHRQNWAKPVQSGTTVAEGVFVFEGRAHGDVGVQLTSPDGQPARATVVFWQGEPAPPSMAAVYTNPELQASAGNGGMSGPGPGSFVLYLIVALLVVIVVLLAVMLFRKGKGGAAALVLVAGVYGGMSWPGPVEALTADDPPTNPFTGQGINRPSKPGPKDPKPDAPPDPFAVDGPVPEVPRDKDKDASAGKPGDKDKDAPKDKPEDKPGGDDPASPFAGETTTGSGRPIDLKPDDFDPSNAPKDEPGRGDPVPGGGPEEGMGPDDLGPGEAPIDDGYTDRLADAERRINELDRQASANRAEIERLKMMQESDREMEPNPSNLPPMPLTCRPPAVERDDDEEMGAAWDNYDACQACYRDPFRELDELLLNYERLRIIYMSTADFVSTAITMGDTVPKPHQFVEMAWAQQKADIQKSFQGTKDAYDAKWAEFNDEMTGVLDAIGQCEADLNNNPMWRSTEGEMFYRTIRASYQRTN
jgi:hypothetical protein